MCGFEKAQPAKLDERNFAAGEFELEDERSWRAPGLILHLPDLPSRVRRGREGHPDELLLVLDLEAGERTWTIDYELLD